MAPTSLSRLTLVCAALAASARCTLPLAPTTTVTLTVQVLEIQTERPIEGASVFVDDKPPARTDAAGIVLVPATSGRLVTIAAIAPGYRRSLTASGIPYTAERWTFFLEPLTHLEEPW